MEHIKHDHDFFAALCKSLKKDSGVILLSVPHEKVFPVVQTRNHFHYRHYNVEDMEALCAANCMMITKIYGQGNASDPDLTDDLTKNCLFYVIENAA